MKLETRNKLSQALTGRKLSPKHISNMSKALTGRKLSEATKAKMSVSAKLRHARDRQAQTSAK